MNRNWTLKLVVLLVSMALLLCGGIEMLSDPALRQLRTVSIAELEQGKAIPHGQFVEIKDAYWLPWYMVEQGYRRKHGEVDVFVPMGSKGMQQQAHEHDKVKPVLWVRLNRGFPTRESADAAMHDPAAYLKPLPVSGLIRGLKDSVREEMSRDVTLQIDQPLALDAGSTPRSFGAATGVAFAGGLLVLVLVLWVASDLQAAKWLQALERPGVQAFQGRTAWALAARIAAPLFVVFGSLALAESIDDRVVETGQSAFSLTNLALLTLALWRSRAAVLLGLDTLELVTNSKRSTVLLAEVTALGVEEREVKRVKVCKYTLHGPAKPVQVGSGLFQGGLDDAGAFGVNLRELLLRRLGPVLMEQIQRGERVSFGPLSLSQHGIGKDKFGSTDVLSWSEVQSTSLKDGQLTIRQRGKLIRWGRFAANKILNIDVLMHIFQTRVG